jgi:hypothetical protein
LLPFFDGEIWSNIYPPFKNRGNGNKLKGGNRAFWGVYTEGSPFVILPFRKIFIVVAIT